MITEDQSSVVAFLGSPVTHGGAQVERIDTHASIVFLAGDRAWKLKRAVRYDYLDYSTADRRRAMCEAEVRINRRTAPVLYRGVTAVTRQVDGRLAIGGTGTPVDWLVEMTRFDQGGLFDRLAEAGVLPLKLMSPLAHAIARFHHTADSSMDQGGWDAMRRVIDGQCRRVRGGRGRHPRSAPMHQAHRPCAVRARSRRRRVGPTPRRGPGSPLPWRPSPSQHHVAGRAADAVRCD